MQVLAQYLNVRDVKVNNKNADGDEHFESSNTDWTTIITAE